MKQRSIAVYVALVIIALIVVNCIAWFVGGEVKFRVMEIFSSGFLMGMFAMYIATHIYQ
jgi:hypothetical protein